MPPLRQPAPASRLPGCALAALLAFLPLLLAACGGQTAGRGLAAPATPLTVFAAASLTDAFDELKRQLEAADPGTTITYQFGASSTLATQLEQGARADLFAPADQPTMERARRAGLLQGEARVFARNTLVVIASANNPRGIATPRDLAKPGVKLVLAGKDVPVGNYARQALDRLSADPAYGADFSRRALANLVSEEANVRQVVARVQLGEADAGIVYASDVTPALRDQVEVIAIPEQFNVVAEYPVAVLEGAANEHGARAFISYLLSPAGQAVLARHGFIPVERPAGATGTATFHFEQARLVAARTVEAAGRNGA